MRTVLRFASWTLAGFTLGLALAMSVPAIAGYGTLTVLSGSMEPTLHVGSVVLSARIPAVEAQPGQIVTFHDPTRHGQLVSHRLLRMRVRDDVAQMETRGDANSASEQWSMPANGTIGRVDYRIPLLGRMRSQLDSRVVRLALLGGVPLCGLLVLLELWRPRRRSPAAA
jgi:signal peptidase